MTTSGFIILWRSHAHAADNCSSISGFDVIVSSLVKLLDLSVKLAVNDAGPFCGFCRSTGNCVAKCCLEGGPKRTFTK